MRRRCRLFCSQRCASARERHGPRVWFILAYWTLAAFPPAGTAASAGGPYQATGFKVGELSSSSAIVWTRLTRRPHRNPSDGPMVALLPAATAADESTAAQSGPGPLQVVYPPGKTVADIRDAVPGAPGQVRLLYKTTDSDDWIDTPWQAVDENRDFTRQFTLQDLRPDSSYCIRVAARAGAAGPHGQVLDGGFRTAPAPNQPARIVFAVSTGQAYVDRDCPEGFRIYAEILKVNPSFFVHTGDIVYYDQLAKTIGLARYHWQRTYSLPSNVAFHRLVGSYFIKDDHDTWQNDCWPALKNDKMHEFTFAQGLHVFREQVPMGPRTYRTCRWGQDLQVWLVEGRDFRSPNTDPDGPEKTIWGQQQKEWFWKTVAASPATFKILISPTPVVGPDRLNKHDNHSNRDFHYEGSQIRAFLARQKNMVVVCGDRHWQYLSVDPKTGVREYSCGPASDAHAGGWSDEQFMPEYHRFLKVQGGFLSGTVDRPGGVPTLTMRFHCVDGTVRHEETLRVAEGRLAPK